MHWASPSQWWGTDVLVAVVGTAGLSQTEVSGQLGHDPGGRDFTVDGVGDDRGAQSHYGSGRHPPVEEVRTGLVLQELDAVIGVQETGDADDVNGIGFGCTFLNFLSSSTGVADAGTQSTVGDVTGAGRFRIRKNFWSTRRRRCSSERDAWCLL